MFGHEGPLKAKCTEFHWADPARLDKKKIPAFFQKNIEIVYF
jgi:hypothetical protein